VAKAGFSLQRHVPPIAICGAGVALVWLTSEPSGLLVAMTGLSVIGGRRASLWSTAGFGLALTAFVLAVGLETFAEHQDSTRLAVFFAVGLGISGLIHLNQIAGRDQKTAEFALRDRERRLRQLIDAVPALIWSTTREGTPTYLNKRFTDATGATLDEITAPDGSPSLSIIHPDERGAAAQAIARSFKAGVPYVMRYRQFRRGGSYRWTETRAEPLRDDAGDIVQWYGVSVDIGDQMHAEEALRKARDKLAHATQVASLAELSASIAHEVNQPLAAIVATSHACRRWLSADPPNLERAGITLERIIRDANSASEVVSRIRVLFSRMGKTGSPADITEVITEVCRLIADELTLKNIRVETECDPSLPPAHIDRIQMQQVLVNLIRNAIDALDPMVDDTRLIRLRAILEGENTIRIEIRDLGVGIKEPERIFEPFFTTKENGLGMGLAICRSIIEAHDGRLWATANEPRGTTVAFTLPLQARKAV
jgi:hypothetical protein